MSLIDLNKQVSQAEFAQMVGISERHARTLAARGIIEAGANGRAWIKSYAGHLREEAAARSATNGLSLPDERAALARAQTERIRRENLAALAELAPAAHLRIALDHAADSIAPVLQAASQRIKAAIPDLPPRALALLDEALARCNEELATLRLPIDEQLDQACGRDVED